MSRNNLSSKDCVPLSVKTTSTQYVVFPIRLVIFMLSARSSFIHGSIGCVQGSHAAKLFCCHGFVSISVKLVQVVPFPAAPGAIHFGAPVEHLTETLSRHFLVSPFQAAKERPAGWLAEECRSIRFSCCALPAAAVRRYLHCHRVPEGGSRNQFVLYLPRNELRGWIQSAVYWKEGNGGESMFARLPD